MGNGPTKQNLKYFSPEDDKYNQFYLKTNLKTAPPTQTRLPIKCIPSKTYLDRGNSTVVCQWDENNRENVAVKKINCLFLSLEQRKIILKEAELLKSLDHPNIVRFLEAKEQDNFIYIFLEFMDMGSLQEKIREHGRLSENITQVYLVQILKGLEFLHVKGILHRDLKCANILHNSDGLVKLTDFGSAKYLNECAGSRVGTCGFTAPEVR